MILTVNGFAVLAKIVDYKHLTDFNNHWIIIVVGQHITGKRLVFKILVGIWSKYCFPVDFGKLSGSENFIYRIVSDE